LNKYKNTSIVLIIFISSLFIFVLYFIFFQLYPQELFICDVYKTSTLKLNSINFEFLYPLNKCDDKIYLNTVLTLENIISEGNNPYQNRPLYLISSYLIYQSLDFFVKDSNSFISVLPELSYFIVQLIYFVTAVFITMKILAKYFVINKTDIIMGTVLLSLNPLIQFGVFTPSNHTLTFLVFVVSLYFLEKLQNSKRLFFYSLMLGFLFLLNRSFFISLIAINLFFLYKNRNRYKVLILNGISIVIFFIPNFLYKQFLSYNSVNLYDINTEFYGQFIWLSKYFNEGIGFWISKILLPDKLFDLRLTKSWDSNSSKEEWYCQNIPENFVCYANDSIELLKYLTIPVLLVSIFLFYNKFRSTILHRVFLVGAVSYGFWSLIGWYPPVRFNMYSLGNLLFVLIIIGFLQLESLKYKICYFIICNLYLFNIVHWNNPNLLSFNLKTLILLISVFAFGFISFRNNVKLKISSSVNDQNK